MLRYVLLWVPMVAIAIGNGVLRQAWYGRHLSELRAHQVSTLTGVLLLGAYMAWVFRRWPARPGSRAAAVGAVWVVLTVGFEFLFGHYAAGHPWERLVADYNLAEGRLWPVVLAWVAAAPWLLSRRGR